MFDKLSLTRNDILLLLPSETENLTRTTASGLDVHTLNSQTYNPVYGTVIQKADGCKQVHLGDKCFFQIFTFSVAKERAYGHEQEDLSGEYSPVKHFAFKEDGKWYMIIREDALYFLFRNWKTVDGNILTHLPSAMSLIPLNGYTLATPVDKKEEELISVSLKHYEDKQYELNTAKVFASSESWLKSGDIVKTLRFCDITMEEEYNHPILPDNFFIIESQNIIAIMAEKYQAGQKRVIVKPNPVEQESTGGLIDTSRGKERLLTGVVLSVGKDCADWNEGDVILYARNSGMPIPSDDGDLLVLADIDVFAKILN